MLGAALASRESGVGNSVWVTGSQNSSCSPVRDDADVSRSRTRRGRGLSEEKFVASVATVLCDQTLENVSLGPVEIDGEIWNGVMPPHGHIGELDDETLA